MTVSEVKEYSGATEHIKKVLVIDDAFALPDESDVSGGDSSLFRQSLIEDANRLEEIRMLCRLDTEFNPAVPAHVSDIISDNEKLQLLWRTAWDEPDHWLHETLFHDYSNKVLSLKGDLEGLFTALHSIQCQIVTYYELDFERIDIGEVDAVFLDSYLKGETLNQESLKRAVELGKHIYERRKDGNLQKYPLVVLMSSRDGAASTSEEFKKNTGLRADFFRFIEKANLQEALAADINGLLRHYTQQQKLTNLLDEYWIAANRAANGLRDALLAIEPTELSLLEEAELGVEKALLPDYLSWLASEFLGAQLFSDTELQKRSTEIPNALAHVSFPGLVPPQSALADIYARSVMRLDINDAVQHSKGAAVALGDVFAQFDKDNGCLTSFLLVIDQSCDLARPQDIQKTSVLCLQAKAQILTDIARPLYRTDTRQSADIVPIDIAGKKTYFLTNWDTVNPCTVSLKSLQEREGNLQRVARFKNQRALARQESLLQRVGRIGEPVPPPDFCAYKAVVILNTKDSENKPLTVRFDASKQAWASVIMVQGRHLEYNKGVQPEVRGKREDTKALSKVSSTEHFNNWLIPLISNDATPGTKHFANLKTALVAALEGGKFQRLTVPATSGSSTDANPPSRKIKVGSTNQEVTLCFHEEAPELGTSPVALLLTPYS